MSEARLYLITPPRLDPKFPDALAAALDAGGVACVRLALDAEEAGLRRAADALRAVCAPRGTPLVIAEHWRLARPHGLDGAHLAEGGAAALRRARETLGADAILGVHAGASRHRGLVAGEAGADYVAFGPARAGALGGGEEAGEALFSWWDEMIETPSVAEGGLRPEDAGRLRADFFAPRMSVWSHPGGAAAAVAEWRRRLEEAGAAAEGASAMRSHGAADAS